MKSIIQLPRICFALLLGFLLQSSPSLAHFGSKGPYGGSVSCGIVNDTVVYLGCVNGGVFYSSKQSLTGWTPKPVGLRSGKITALAHTGTYLFAGTADSGIFRFTGFIGTDRYWVKVNTGLNNLQIKSMVAIDSITLLAGTNGGGVYKTTNKGATWTAANTGLSGTAIITGLVKAGSRIIATSQAGGLFKSDDNGATWSDFNDVNTLNISGTNALSYNSATGELLVVNSSGLFITTSASTATVAPTYTASQTGLPGGINIRSISNNGTNWYLATDQGVYTSITGTISWLTANTNLTTLDVNVVVPVPFSSSRLVVGTNKGGIFKSPASSISWTSNNTSFNNLATYSIATSGNQVIIAATEQGVFRSTDLAATYTAANSGLTDNSNVTDLEFLGTNLLASTKNAGVFISADTGKTWVTLNNGLNESNIKDILIVGSNMFLFSASGKVYQWNNNVLTWTNIQTGLSGGIIPTSLTLFNNKLLLTTLGNGVFVKPVTGSTWAAANTNLTNLNVTSSTFSGKKVFVGTNGNGVFVSDTAAISWTNTTTPSVSFTTIVGLDGSKVQAMASNGAYVFASFKGELLATKDDGATWVGATQFNLPSYSNISKIVFTQLAPGRMFVTTENNCLYSNSMSELPLAARVSVDKATSCNGVSDGVASALAAGGSAPFTFLWQNGQTTSSVSGLGAGTYSVVISDNSTNKDTLTFTVGQPSVLSISTGSTPASTAYSSDGSGIVTVSGGTTPYNYLWNNFSTTATITNISAGIYTVHVTDYNGCEIAANTTVSAPTATGINTLKGNSESMTLYPNPNNGNFSIDFGNDTQAKTIEITNSIGVVMQSIKGNIEQLVKINANYSSGIYFVKITTGDKIEIKKIIIE
jgi:hypothetical protein